MSNKLCLAEVVEIDEYKPQKDIQANIDKMSAKGYEPISIAPIVTGGNMFLGAGGGVETVKVIIIYKLSVANEKKETLK